MVHRLQDGQNSVKGQHNMQLVYIHENSLHDDNAVTDADATANAVMLAMMAFFDMVIAIQQRTRGSMQVIRTYQLQPFVHSLHVGNQTHILISRLRCMATADMPAAGTPAAGLPLITCAAVCACWCSAHLPLSLSAQAQPSHCNVNKQCTHACSGSTIKCGTVQPPHQLCTC